MFGVAEEASQKGGWYNSVIQGVEERVLRESLARNALVVLQLKHRGSESVRRKSRRIYF